MVDHTRTGQQFAAVLARQALHAFASTVTVPLIILGKNDEKPIHRGTGVLFAARGRHFLITAEHVLNGAAIERMSIPPRGRKERLRPIGTVGMWLPHDQKYDVGILEFLEPESVKWLRANYGFLGPENIANGNLDAGALLCGFPVSLVTIDDKIVAGEPLFVDSTLLKKLPAELKYELVGGMEIFAAYDRKGICPDTGSEVTAPDLSGASGCGVWQYFNPKSAIWTPQECVRLVAVQNSFRPGEFFRAMTWNVVHQSFIGLAPEIAQDIFTAVFNQRP